MTARHYMLLSKICIALAAALFAFDVLDSLFLFAAGSRTPDAAGGFVMPLNFYKGFRLYVTTTEYWIFIGSLACAGLLFLLGVFFYARLKRAAAGLVEK